MSTFHGLEMAKQALFTQQSALHTTGHNIANANTEGYSRQRVNFEADLAMPAAAKNRMGIPGQIGTGVKAGSIERIRNDFLDLQYRGESSLAGYWEKRSDALGRMENVLNDLNETGLSAVMDQFWSSLQDLAVNPTNAGARSVVVQRGIALSDTFNHLNQSLTKIRGDLEYEIDQTVKNVNNITENIQELNKQIKSLEVNGYVTNDLYDERDRLIDQLSRILPIEVTKVPSGDHVNKVAEGTVKIEVKNSNGELIPLIDEEVVNEIKEEDNKIKIQSNATEGNPNWQEIDIENQGSLQSLIDAYAEDFVEMQASLKEMAKGFTTEFNNVHGEVTGGGSFFNVIVDDADWEMSVNEIIIDDPGLIAASPSGGGQGDGSLALELSGLFDKKLSFGNGGTESLSVREFYAEKIGKLSVELEDAERMQRNTTVLLTQLEGNRQSVSSVSLDEEMTNMIKFQHAYNAAARSMTATDELLDRIINNMGLVGR